MTLNQKGGIIVNVVKRHGKQLALPNLFDYFGVEVLYDSKSSRWHILLPFILNVSIGDKDVRFYAGDDHILNCLFDKLYPVADV